MIDGCRRPGILVLINEVDWELWYVSMAIRVHDTNSKRQASASCSGTLDTELQEGDTVVFISTLHGG